MKTQVQNTANEASGKSPLTAILYLLQTELGRLTNEVDRSYELYKLGEKTDLVRSLESMVNDPVGNLSGMSRRIDENIISLVDRYVRQFLLGQKDILSTVLKSETSTNQLLYFVVLKSDNMEGRMQITNFLCEYDALNISEKYPVSFQFVPLELVSKMLCSTDKCKTSLASFMIGKLPYFFIRFCTGFTHSPRKKALILELLIRT